MNETLNMRVEKYKIKNLSSEFMSRVELYVCHDKFNKNQYFISLKTLKNAEPTLFRKPLLYKLNMAGTDFLEHEQDLSIGGYISEVDNDLRYEEVDGRIYVVVSAIVWNAYVPQVVAILERDGVKGISMEIKVSKSAKRKDGYTEILEFQYLGVVLLGDKYETGMYNTTAKLINFTKDNLKDLIDESERILKYKLLEKEMKEEEQMFDKNAHAETFKVTAKDMYTMIYEAMSEDFMVEDYCGEFIYVYSFEDGKFYGIPYAIEEGKVSVDYGCKKRMKLQFVDFAKDENVEEYKDFAQEIIAKKGEELTAKELEFASKIEELTASNQELKASNEDLSSKFSAKEEELKTINESIEADKTSIKEKDEAIFSLDEKVKSLEGELEAKETAIQELSTFKAEKLNEERKENVKNLFTKLASSLSKNEIETWKEKETTYESFDSFESDISKFALEKILANVDNDKAKFSRMNIVGNEEKEIEKPKSIWEEVEEKVK